MNFVLYEPLAYRRAQNGTIQFIKEEFIVCLIFTVQVHVKGRAKIYE